MMGLPFHSIRCPVTGEVDAFEIGANHAFVTKRQRVVVARLEIVFELDVDLLVVRIIKRASGEDLSHVFVLDHDNGKSDILAVKDNKIGLFFDRENHFHLAAQEERRQIGMQDDAVTKRRDGVG